MMHILSICPNSTSIFDFPLKSPSTSKVALRGNLEPKFKSVIHVPSKCPTKDPSKKINKRKFVKVKEIVHGGDDVIMV